jgi:protein SCO1/2
MMKSMSRRQVLGMLGAFPVAGQLLTGGRLHAQTSVGGFQAGNKTSRERLAENHFPNVMLTTQDGKKVRFYDDLIKDKIVLLNFFYARCDGICPGTTANLVKVQRLLGDHVGRDVFMYSITLKPEQDTPAVLKSYAQAYKAGPGWTFLTGEPQDIELLRRKLGFTNPDPALDAVKSQHIGMLRYGNEPRQLWAGCPGLAHASYIVKSFGWAVDLPQSGKEVRK